MITILAAGHLPNGFGNLAATKDKKDRAISIEKRFKVITKSTCFIYYLFTFHILNNTNTRFNDTNAMR